MSVQVVSQIKTSNLGCVVLVVVAIPVVDRFENSFSCFAWSLLRPLVGLA